VIVFSFISEASGDVLGILDDVVVAAQMESNVTLFLLLDVAPRLPAGQAGSLIVRMETTGS